VWITRHIRPFEHRAAEHLALALVLQARHHRPAVAGGERSARGDRRVRSGGTAPSKAYCWQSQGGLRQLALRCHTPGWRLTDGCKPCLLGVHALI
jgi:hypothetical protein